MTTRFFHKSFENEDLETKNLFPQQRPYETMQEREMPSWKENGEGKVGMRGENVHGIRKYCWFFNILHHMIKWSFANLPFHFDQI